MQNIKSIIYLCYHISSYIYSSNDLKVYGTGNCIIPILGEAETQCCFLFHAPYIELCFKCNGELTVPNETMCTYTVADEKDDSRYLPGLFKCLSTRCKQRHSISHPMTFILTHFKIYYMQVLKHVSLKFSFCEHSCE